MFKPLTCRNRPELAWTGVESNEFGTDEFMQWCGKVGTEPYLCLNFGTGTLDEALGWVEYCNGTSDTHYANLRRKNPLKPTQQGVAPLDKRIRRECRGSRDRQAEQHCDILKSGGHLPEWEV